MLRNVFKTGNGVQSENQQPKVADGERIYAIGDIHGRCDLLTRLLRKLVDDAEARRDGRKLKFVFLGDYIDRGDESDTVLETLIALKAAAPDACVFLLGNHEHALLKFMHSPVQHDAWLNYGAEQTLAAYGVQIPKNSATEEALVHTRDSLERKMGTHLAFIEGMKTYEVSGDVIFTHAGFDPKDIHKKENVEAMLWGNTGSHQDTPVPGKLLVHGHFDTLYPVRKPGRICIDTGAYYTGRLTALRIDHDLEFIST